MTLKEQIESSLSAWPRLRDEGGRVVVPTHVMFASGDLVRVCVDGGGETSIVHDNGSAIDEFSSNGGEHRNAVRSIRSILAGRGFTVSDAGVISSPRVPITDVAPTIALVANAAREACDHLLNSWRPLARRDFKAVLKTLLAKEFPQVQENQRHLGHSNKQHRFDFALPFDGGELLIDAVQLDQNAISTAVLKSLDVAAEKNDKVILRLVYDDEQDWKSDDINLLKLGGGKPVPFSQASHAIHQLAA